jgi:hypothetical protein
MADQDGAFSALESLLGDRYTREARLAPAFLSVFPIFLLLISLFSGLRGAVPALLTLFCVFGVVRWISHIARGVGDRREKELFADWGGKPTTTMLRYAARRPGAEATRGGREARYLLREAPRLEDIKKAIARRNGPQFPSEEADRSAVEKDAQEEWRGRHLDSLYEPVVAWLRENTRLNKLVFEENISYGFQRNLYALKSFAITCGILALLVQGAVAYAAWNGCWPEPISRPVAVAVLLAIVAYLTGVGLFVSEQGVMIQGFTYARQLLDSVYDDPSADKADKGEAGSEESN